MCLFQHVARQKQCYSLKMICWRGPPRLLIQAGVDLNAQDWDGWTPLHAASHWGQKGACRLLCDSLANMALPNHVGQTCFDLADPEVLPTLEELKKKQASVSGGGWRVPAGLSPLRTLRRTSAEISFCGLTLLWRPESTAVPSKYAQKIDTFS